MRKHFTYILTLLICYSCSEKRNEWKVERNATIFFGSEKNVKFELTYYKNGDSLTYKYENQIDTSKTIYIRKNTDSDSLLWLWEFEKFIKINKTF